MVTLAGVMTARLRHPGLSLVLLILLGAMALAWWRLTTPLFTIVAISLVTLSALAVGCWDAFHQTQPDELASRGIYPDDRSLPVYDPGLRREFTPMIPAALSQRMARRHTRPGKAIRQPARPPARGRPAAAAAPALGPALPPPRVGGRERGMPARSGQPRQRTELL